MTLVCSLSVCLICTKKHFIAMETGLILHNHNSIYFFKGKVFRLFLSNRTVLINTICSKKFLPTVHEHSIYRHLIDSHIVRFNVLKVSVVSGVCSFSSELTKSGSSGATECRVWIGSFNVKVWKSTEHKLYKMWRSLQFYTNSGKRAHPRNSKLDWVFGKQFFLTGVKFTDLTVFTVTYKTQ